MGLDSWRVYLFGFFLLISLFVFLFVVFKRGRELYFDEESLLDEVFYLLFYGFIGGRLLYAVLHWSRFVGQPLGVLNIFGMPGLYYPGFFVGGFLAFILRSRSKKWDTYVAGDILVAGWTLLYALVSLSMLIGGVGYGIATNLFIGMHFPGVYDARHPVQLYESVFYLLLFVWLWKLEDVYRTFSWYKANRSEANSGFISAVFLMMHGLLGMGFLQLKPVTLVIVGIRLETIIYLVMFVLGVYLLHCRSGKGLGNILRNLTEVFSTKRK